VFAVIGHPTTLCPQPLMGYTPPPAITARIANEYPQVVGILLSGITDDYYLVELMRELRRDVPVYVSPPGSMNLLSLGAAGLESPLANLMPLTCRAYLDRFDAGDLEGASSAYADITRVMEYTNHWKGATPRWIKAALKVFKLPGGDGGLREPYLMHSDAELERFATGIIALDVAEINDLARAAGRL
jgi:dihydrodipicolinate synthase/N-acetylneuraminate lyase